MTLTNTLREILAHEEHHARRRRALYELTHDEHGRVIPDELIGEGDIEAMMEEMENG